MKLLREPLVQFLLVGGALFLWFRLASPPAVEPPRQIVINEGLVDHLATNFARTWQRQPTDEEMSGLVTEYVRDEIAYREALALGLDRDDSIVRRRMRQKLEFLSDEVGAAGEPDDEELALFLAANPDAYAVDPQFAFFQVYLNPDRHTDLGSTVRETLSGLPDNPIEELNDGSIELGDSLMLPGYIELAPLWQIRRLFGETFADELVGLAPGSWVGPVPSGYGVHLVYLTESVPGRIPPLAEIRDSVLRDWKARQTELFKESFYEALASRYEIVYDLPDNEAIEADE